MFNKMKQRLFYEKEELTQLPSIVLHHQMS